MDKLLSGLGNRVFLMNNVHDDEPTIFETRWVLSYLRGPLTRDQIQTLMAPRKQAATPAQPAPGSGDLPTPAAPLSTSPPPTTSESGSRPVVPPDVPEFFLPRRGKLDAGATLQYRPALLGVARLHYTDKKLGVDHWETLGLLRPIGAEMPADVWDDGERFTDHVPELDKTAEPAASFAPLPAELTRVKSYAEWTKALKNHLYRVHKLSIWHSAQLNAYSKPEEREHDSRVRLVQGSRAAQPGDGRAAPSTHQSGTAPGKGPQGSWKLDKQQAEASKSKWDAAFSFGNSVLGRVPGQENDDQGKRGQGQLGRQGRNPCHAKMDRRRPGRGRPRRRIDRVHEHGNRVQG